MRAWPRSKGTLTARRSRRRLAQEAGLSLHQYRQAMRVSNIPKDEFERLVESDNPPTIEALARLGTKRGRRRGPKTIPCRHCGGTGRVPVTELLK
jgi:hypothetical protein